EQGKLVAHPYDPDRSAPPGPAVQLADHAISGFGFMYSGVSASDGGMVAYVGEPLSAVSTLEWTDHTATHASVVGDQGAFVEGRLSPDGTRLAVGILSAALDEDLWTQDLANGSRARLTFSGARSPVWSPDGTRVAFVSHQQGHYLVQVKPSSGGGV